VGDVARFSVNRRPSSTLSRPSVECTDVYFIQRHIFYQGNFSAIDHEINFHPRCLHFHFVIQDLTFCALQVSFQLALNIYSTEPFDNNKT